MRDLCAAPRCVKPAKCRGYCGPHYEQQRRTGRLRPIRPLRTPGPWPFQQLVDRLRVDTKHDACIALGLNPSVYDAYIVGGLNDYGADLLATRAGLHPAQVWGWDWATAGLTPLDELFLRSGWRQAWLWAEETAA